MSAAMQPVGPMSTEAFLAWEPGDGRRWQLVDGEPRAMAPAGITHGLIQAALTAALQNHLDASPDCRVVVTPGVVPPTLAATNVRVPDLAVTCTKQPPGQFILADPVLLVEILSPGNKAATWHNVWAYTSIPSVREILVLQSERVGAELIRRKPDGTWPDTPDSLSAGMLVLDSIGLTVELAWLYRRTGLPLA